MEESRILDLWLKKLNGYLFLKMENAREMNLSLGAIGEIKNSLWIW